MKTIVSFLLAIIIAQNTFSAIIYVTPLGAGSQNGSSWANAFAGNSLQAAINGAVNGDEVWVAAGTYLTTNTANRNISFSMRNGVRIYGSFTGVEATLSQRNLSTGLSSILSAEIGVPGNADNSYHTISNSALDTTAFIDGFIIRDANDNRAATISDGLGGGIYNNGRDGSFCSPTIRNCIISNNQARFGAGIFNSGYNSGNASPQIINCVITNNNALDGGAGIDNFGILNGNASPTILNSIIYNNTATFRAGGMYCWGGNNGNTSPIVINTLFVNNSAVDGGGVVCDNLNASGGGNSGSSNPNFKNCIFWGNTATTTGPQFFILGTANFVATYSDIDLTGQTLPHIISGAGTGNKNSDPDFTNIALGTGIDGIWLTTDDGLQLQNTSSLLDVGDNADVYTTDILGNARIINTQVDLGAYEFNIVPLAIESLVFWTQNVEGMVVLHWESANSIDDSHFEIERSSDGIAFSTIGEHIIDNSSTPQLYQFKDTSPLSIGYYRLKQVDINGHFSYSEVKKCTLINRENKVVIYPNPSTDKIWIKSEKAIQVKVFDIIGTFLLETEIPKTFHQIDISSYEAGIYLIQIEGQISKVYKY